MDPSHVTRVHSLLSRSVRHLRAMSVSAQPPLSFGCWRVVMGTWNVAPFQINHVHIVISCWTWHVGGGRICARYHILANRHVCTYFIRCVRHKFLSYAFRACAHTTLFMLVLFSFVDISNVDPNITPSILTCWYSSIPISEIGADQPHRVRALDFWGLSCAPVACSYVLTAWQMVLMSVGCVTKTVISSM